MCSAILYLSTDQRISPPQSKKHQKSNGLTQNSRPFSAVKLKHPHRAIPDNRPARASYVRIGQPFRSISKIMSSSSTSDTGLIIAGVSAENAFPTTTSVGTGISPPRRRLVNKRFRLIDKISLNQRIADGITGTAMVFAIPPPESTDQPPSTETPEQPACLRLYPPLSPPSVLRDPQRLAESFKLSCQQRPAQASGAWCASPWWTPGRDARFQTHPSQIHHKSRHFLRSASSSAFSPRSAVSQALPRPPQYQHHQPVWPVARADSTGAQISATGAKE